MKQYRIEGRPNTTTNNGLGVSEIKGMGIIDQISIDKIIKGCHGPQKFYQGTSFSIDICKMFFPFSCTNLSDGVFSGHIKYLMLSLLTLVFVKEQDDLISYHSHKSLSETSSFSRSSSFIQSSMRRPQILVKKKDRNVPIFIETWCTEL